MCMSVHVCSYMCLCMSMCCLPVCASEHVWVLSVHVCMSMSMCVFVCALLCMRMWVCICMCLCVHAYVCLCVHECVCYAHTFLLCGTLRWFTVHLCVCCSRWNLSYFHDLGKLFTEEKHYKLDIWYWLWL